MSDAMSNKNLPDNQGPILPPSLQLMPPHPQQPPVPQPPPPPLMVTPPGHHSIGSLSSSDLKKSQQNQQSHPNLHPSPHHHQQQSSALRALQQHMTPSVYEMAALTQDLDTQVITTKIKEALLANNIGQKVNIIFNCEYLLRWCTEARLYRDKLIENQVQKMNWGCEFFFRCMKENDHLFGIVVSMPDCHPRGPGFDSWLYLRNFPGSIGSGTGSTQPCEDNCIATWYEK